MSYSPRTKSRLRSIESNAASRFESTLLSNAVHDRIGEDDQLAEMIEASERCMRAEEMRVDELSKTGDTISADLDRASDSIDTLVTTRVNEAIVEILESLSRELHQWDDAWSEAEIEEARSEIQDYLSEKVEA